MKRHWVKYVAGFVLFSMVGILVGYQHEKGSAPVLSASADDKPAETSVAVKGLIEALKDKDAEVRKNAAVSLGRIGKGARAAVPALAAALKDSDADVRARPRWPWAGLAKTRRKPPTR